MSELLNALNKKFGLRPQLLTTVSALTLLIMVHQTSESQAADQDADRPTVWITLGGQMNHIEGQGDPFAIGFLARNPSSSVLQGTTPLEAQNPVPFSFGEEGSISVQPTGSNWVFSAAVRYGRSNNTKRVHHQTTKIFYRSYKYGTKVPGINKHGTNDFVDTQVNNRESHAIVDFAVGKDVGLGVFGTAGTSTLNLGVRFAQFSSMATLGVRGRPDLRIKDLQATPNFTLHLPYFHTYHLSGQAARSFHGVGPSLSWNGSASVAGNAENGELALDWGANLAVLFGRQRASVQHHESGHYVGPLAGLTNPSGRYATPSYAGSGGHPTDRSVIVPNVGGFAGATFRVEHFKASFGYRADFFFGAMDGGVDARKSETLGFYGPFATISIGLGG